eukprot:1809632-Ditylum_brightwellii.AAC.1
MEIHIFGFPSLNEENMTMVKLSYIVAATEQEDTGKSPVIFISPSGDVKNCLMIFEGNRKEKGMNVGVDKINCTNTGALGTNQGDYDASIEYIPVDN